MVIYISVKHNTEGVAMSFNYDSWLYGQVDAYCSQPEPKERYIDNLYRVFWNDKNSSWYDDFTEEEIVQMHEDDVEPEHVVIYSLIEEYFSDYESEEIVRVKIDSDPVYEGML